MELSSLSCSSTRLSYLPLHLRNPRSPPFSVGPALLISSASSSDETPKPSLRISTDFAPKARFVARRRESIPVQQLERPLSNVYLVAPFLLCFEFNNWLGYIVVAVEYMSLPASQYSVLDAQRIERVDANTFRCYVYSFKFFAFEVCPVLLVSVEEQPDGCCIKLLSCKVYIHT